MQRQFTATAYVLDKNQVLLLWHRKLGKWLPPGGHMEANETPPEAVVREVKEETGLDVEIIQDERVWVERWNASSFPRPYLCLLEEIPPMGDQPAHQHMDLLYLARPVNGCIHSSEREDHDVRWFTWEQVAALAPDNEIFVETRQVIEHLLCDRKF